MPSTQTTQKRKRACDSCHRRKIQCDSADVPSPNCNWCHHHGMTCTFNRIGGRKTWARNRNGSGSTTAGSSSLNPATNSTSTPSAGPSPSSAVVDVSIGPSSSDPRPPNAPQSQPQLYQQPHPSPLPPHQQPLPPLAAHLGISSRPVSSNPDLRDSHHRHSSLSGSIDDRIYAQHLDPYQPHSRSSSTASTPSGTSTSGFRAPTRPASRSGGSSYHAFPFSVHTSEAFHPSPLSRTHSPHGSVSSDHTHHTNHTPAQYQHQAQDHNQHQHQYQHQYQQQPHQPQPDQIHPVYSHFPVPNPGCGSYFGKLHFAGYHLGEISSYNGIPFFSEDGQAWIRSRTGQDASFPAIWGDVPPWQTRPSVDSVFLSKVAQQPIGQIELPDRKVVEQYFSFFISSEFRLAFPLVDPVLFKQTLDVAYEYDHGDGETNGLSFETITAKACVFAFLSVISLLEAERPPDIPSIDTDMMAAKAQMLLPLTIQALDITTLQTSFMLCLYQLFLGQAKSSAVLLAFACRIMFMLGGHKLSNASWLPTPESRSGSGTTTPASAPVDIADRKRRQLRKLFWLCYSVDTDISLRTGQPPSIDDDHCDLSLPPGYLEIQYLDRQELEALKERHFYPISQPNSHPNMPSPYSFQGATQAVPNPSNINPSSGGNSTTLAQGTGHPYLGHPYLQLDETSVPVLPGDLCLTLIKSKTCKLLYSASALRKSDAELLRDIRELDDELERWRLSVPERYRPALSLPRGQGQETGSGESWKGEGNGEAVSSSYYRGGDGSGSGQPSGSGRETGRQGHGGHGGSTTTTRSGSRGTSRQHGKSYDPTMSAESVRTILINLQYHHLVATIHQATGRCRAWQNRSSVLEENMNARTGEMLMEGVSSSLALSVEASRSTLIYLRSVTRALLGEAFWVIILYPMSAVMTIFCSILLNPLDPQAEDDLRLLESAPDLIKGIRIRRPTQTELLHLKTVDEFMGELMRLGGCAIRRAKEEKRERGLREREREMQRGRMERMEREREIQRGREGGVYGGMGNGGMAGGGYRLPELSEASGREAQRGVETGMIMPGGIL